MQVHLYAINSHVAPQNKRVWHSVYGMVSHPTHNRSFHGQFLQATQPNNQCQSTDGQYGLLTY